MPEKKKSGSEFRTNILSLKYIIEHLFLFVKSFYAFLNKIKERDKILESLRFNVEKFGLWLTLRKKLFIIIYVYPFA